MAVKHLLTADYLAEKQAVKRWTGRCSNWTIIVHNSSPFHPPGENSEPLWGSTNSLLAETCASARLLSRPKPRTKICAQSLPRVCAQNLLPNSFPARISDDRLWLGAKIAPQARGQHVHSEQYGLMSLFRSRREQIGLSLRVKLEEERLSCSPYSSFLPPPLHPWAPKTENYISAGNG